MEIETKRGRMYQFLLARPRISFISFGDNGKRQKATFFRTKKQCETMQQEVAAYSTYLLVNLRTNGCITVGMCVCMVLLLRNHRNRLQLKVYTRKVPLK